MADALVQLCTAQNNGQVKGGRSNLATILITIDINDLNGNTNGPGYTSRGDVIPAEAIRNMTWNANLQRILLDDSMPLDIGRASRLATDSQWRALAVRDGGCRGEDCPIHPNGAKSTTSTNGTPNTDSPTSTGSCCGAASITTSATDQASN